MCLKLISETDARSVGDIAILLVVDRNGRCNYSTSRDKRQPEPFFPCDLQFYLIVFRQRAVIMTKKLM